MDDICGLRSIKRNGKRICGRSRRQGIMRVPELSRRNFTRVCLAIKEVGLGQGVRRVDVVSYDEIAADLRDCEGPNNCAFGEVVTPSPHVERPADWGGALDHPAPVAPNAEGYEGGGFSGDITVSGAVTRRWGRRGLSTRYG